MRTSCLYRWPRKFFGGINAGNAVQVRSATSPQIFAPEGWKNDQFQPRVQKSKGFSTVRNFRLFSSPRSEMAPVSDARCLNVKSRKNPTVRCENPATHGEYCGVHHKHPRKWVPGTPDTVGKRVKRRHTASAIEARSIAVCKIQKWIRVFRPLLTIRRHGAAYYCREACTNDSDFFSVERLVDISGVMFFSFIDGDKHAYGFDIRSIHTVVQKAKMTAGALPENPYNRSELPPRVTRRIAALVRWLTARHAPTEWEPLVPPTPEQQARMKIVDLFGKINEHGYYTSPDWFIELDTRDQRRLYAELFEIWNVRAELSSVDKNRIVPGYSGRLFRHAPWALIDATLESYQKLNMGIIRAFISTAEDRSDRILGAMYVVGALTKVSREARRAYPWLYETIGGGVYEPQPVLARAERRVGIVAGLFGNLFANLFPPLPPPLELPPPAEHT